MAKATTAKKAAESLANRVAPDEPQAAVAVQADLDFAGFDPFQADYYLKKENSGELPDWYAQGHFDVRWLNSDPRVMPKRINAGWEPVVPTIRRGDTILARRPKELTEAERTRIKQLTKQREDAPMRRFESDAQRHTADGNFETFGGSKSARDGL